MVEQRPHMADAFDRAWSLTKGRIVSCPDCDGPADLINEGDLQDPGMIESAKEAGIPLDQLNSVVCHDKQGCGHDELAQPGKESENQYEGFDRYGRGKK